MNPEAKSRVFSSYATFMLQNPTKVNFLPDPDPVGYTVPPDKNGKAQIFISDTADIFRLDANGNKTTDEEAELRQLGVTVHECGHQLFTNFDYEAKRNAEKPAHLQSFYHSVMNICEDPAEEYALHFEVGDMLLTALDAVIAYSWETSPDIDQAIPEDKPNCDLLQILNALIQAGDHGSIKGTFHHDRGREYFGKVLPLFNKCCVEPNGAKRVDISYEIADILLEIADETPQDNLPKSEDRQGSGEGQESQGNDSGEGEQNNIQQKREELAKEYGQPEQEPAEAEENGQEKKSKPCGDKPESVSPQPGKDIKKAMEQLRAEIEKAEEDIRKERERERQREQDRLTDLPENPEIDRIPAPAGERQKQIYESTVAKYRTRITTLAQSLKKIILGDKERRMYSTSGSHVSLKRLSDGKLHPDIMERKIAPNDVGDLAVVLEIDCSGSMGDADKYKHARDCAICLYEAFAMLKLPITVTGFTTNLRKCVQIHMVTWNSPKDDRYKLANISAHISNCDYDAIKDAMLTLDRKRARHKLLIVMSDGLPCGRDGIKDAYQATKDAVAKCRRKGIDVFSIAIGCSDIEMYAEMYGKDYIAIDSPDQLFASTTTCLKSIAKRWRG